MNGGSFTPAGNGQVAEVENDLQYLWQNYQAQPDAIWCSADVKFALEQALVFSSTGQNSYIWNMGGNTQTGGVGKLVADDVVFTASGAMGPFQYAILYDDTAASDELIGYWSYGSSITLASGETFTVDFDGTTGILTNT